MTGQQKQHTRTQVQAMQLDTADEDTEVFIVERGYLCVDRRWLGLWFSNQFAAPQRATEYFS